MPFLWSPQYTSDEQALTPNLAFQNNHPTRFLKAMSSERASYLHGEENHGGTALFAPDVVRVLQRRMSGAPRKRQLATEERRVVKGGLLHRSKRYLHSITSSASC